jgi:alkylresorcinol/alkylpyrone synthase
MTPTDPFPVAAQHDVVPRIVGIGTAVPEHVACQPEVRAMARSIFASADRDIERLLPVFDNSGVERRNFCVPMSWFAQPHSFGECNDRYLVAAMTLSVSAANDALEMAGVGAKDIDAVMFVSSTGMATPSLDSRLVFALGCPTSHIRRDATFGHGCAGGVGGLARAGAWSRANPGRHVLLVATELCSLTFQDTDNSTTNLVSTSLFADGSAAVVVSTEGDGPEIVGDGSTLWPGTQDVMGWHFTERGLGVVLSKSVPRIVTSHFASSVDDVCRRVGIDRTDLAHFVMHPGGAKVLDAFEAVLQLEPAQLCRSREVLRDHGNMSAPTALFVLASFVEHDDMRTGELALVSAMGPGFAAEHVVLRAS